MHDCSLQPATALNLPLQILFWNYSKKKGCFQISRKHSFLQIQVHNIRLQQKRNRCKIFPVTIFWKVARKRYIIKPFNRVTGLLSRIHVSKKFLTLYFFKGYSEKLLFESFGTLQKKLFIRDNFKWLELFNLSSFDVICPAKSTTYSYTENWHLREYFLWVLLESKNF